MYVCMYRCMYVYIYICMYVCIYIYIYMYVYIYIYIYIYIGIRIYTCNKVRWTSLLGALGIASAVTFNAWHQLRSGEGMNILGRETTTRTRGSKNRANRAIRENNTFLICCKSVQDLVLVGFLFLHITYNIMWHVALYITIHYIIEYVLHYSFIIS